MRDNGDWTCHHNYEQISALPNLSHGEYGVISKESREAINKQVDELMLEAFADGYSLDGGSITYEQYEELLRDGWRPSFGFQQCFYDVLVDDKMQNWYDLSDDQRKELIESGEYFDMEEIW